MTLVQRMDELIQKLESNDEAFIEQLNADFENYCETSCQGKDINTQVHLATTRHLSCREEMSL